MHMLSRKDLNSAELDTVRVSRNLQWLSQPTEKCKRTWKRQCTSTTLSSSRRYKSSRIRPQSYRLPNSAKNTDIPMNGTAVKNHIQPQLAEESNATRRTLYRSLSRDYRQVLPAREQVPLLHRYRRARLMTLDQVQQQKEVTIQAFRHRETDCAICQSGKKSSEKISKTKKCQHQGAHPQTLLVIQIRNVIQKWYRGSTVFILTSPERQKLRNLQEKQKLQGLLGRKRTGDAVPRAENFGDLMTADHEVLNEGGESGNEHRYGVVVQKLPLSGCNLIRAKQKSSQEMEKEFTKDSRAVGKAESLLHSQFLGIRQIL